MRATVAGWCLSLAFGAAICMAQEAPVAVTQPAAALSQPWPTSVYCSGFYTSQRVSDELRLVSGEQSEYKITFAWRDIVYLSKGASQGIKPGDRFSVVREKSDLLRVPFFKWQDKLTNAMGTHYVESGLHPRPP